MGFRFQRRIKILPGVSLNIGKRGASVSIGPQGMRTTIGPRGIKNSFGIPGTGIRYETPYSTIQTTQPSSICLTTTHVKPRSHVVKSNSKRGYATQRPTKKTSKRLFNLEYTYPRNTGVTAYPQASQDICEAICRAMAFKQTCSVVMVLSLLGLGSFYISLFAGLVATCVCFCVIVLNKIVSAIMCVRLEYKMDQGWRNYANARMAPFLLMIKCKHLWEETDPPVGHVRTDNVGRSEQKRRIKIHVEHSAPFPIKSNINAYTLDLHDSHLVFLPDCIYMISDQKCMALHYESVKWTIGMATFVETNVPEDSQVVGQTWQHVTKAGKPDRRYSYNPTVYECQYGELFVNFANRRSSKFILSGTKIAKRIMDLKNGEQL